MHRRHVNAPAIAIVVMALGLTGCSHHESAPVELPLTPSAPASAAHPQAATLPSPEALTDVLYRLADPAIPGADKLDLIAGAKPTDAATLDRFATALNDGGYRPLVLEATGIGWSDRDPGNAVATVNVSTPKPDTSAFSLPMEFTPRGPGWQLSHKTAELLLAFGSARAAVPPVR